MCEDEVFAASSNFYLRQLNHSVVRSCSHPCMRGDKAFVELE